MARFLSWLSENPLLGVLTGISTLLSGVVAFAGTIGLPPFWSDTLICGIIFYTVFSWARYVRCQAESQPSLIRTPEGDKCAPHLRLSGKNGRIDTSGLPDPARYACLARLLSSAALGRHELDAMRHIYVQLCFETMPHPSGSAQTCDYRRVHRAGRRFWVQAPEGATLVDLQAAVRSPPMR